MGFGRNTAFADQDDDPAEQHFEAPAPIEFDNTAELAAAFAVPSEGIDFAAPVIDVPVPANDGGIEFAGDTAAPGVAEPDQFLAQLSQTLGGRQGEDVTAMELAPALPGEPSAAGGAPGAPLHAPQAAQPVDPAADAAKDDLGLSADQLALLESLDDEDREKLRRNIRSERERLDQERRRLEMEAKQKAQMPQQPVTGLGAIMALASNVFLRGAGVGGGGDIRKRHEAIQKREAFLQTGFVADRYFDLKRRDFLRTAASIASTQAELSGAVRSYNSAFAATEPGKRYLDRIERLVDKGMQRPAAEAFVREGNVVGAAEDAAAAAKDPRVVAAKTVIDAKTADIEGKAGKFTEDFKLLQKNFPEKISDSAAQEVSKTFERIAKDTPKPVSEPGVDPEQTLEKRLEKMAEGVRELVEAIMKMVRSIFRPQA